MESIAQAIGKSSNASQFLSHNQAMEQSLTCPAFIDEDNSACMADDSLKHLIIHLNDWHKWSREDIADWLDTLESQPVFYPDIRTDDEKIEDAKKEKEKQTPWSNPGHNVLQDIKQAQHLYQQAWVKSPTISSYNTYAPQLTYGGLNAGSTVTVEHNGHTIKGYVTNIEQTYGGIGHNTCTVTFYPV